MEMTLNDEQLAIRTSMRDFLAETEQNEFGITGAWKTVAELGWLGLSYPETLGGCGLTLLEETLLFEELGASLLAPAIFATNALALPALVEAGARDLVELVVAGDRRATLAWADAGASPSLSDAGRTRPSVRASGCGTTLTLNGRKEWVFADAGTDLFIVVASDDDGHFLAAVDGDARGLQLTERETIDATTPRHDLDLADTAARRLAGNEDTQRILDVVWARCMLLSSAEAVGIARRMLDLARDYACEREQFGRKIGSFQAISHKAADMYVSMALSRSAVWAAAQTAEVSPEDARLAIAATVAKAIPGAILSCEQTIQIHGGIGMTWESPIHRYYKRALTLGALDGPPARQRARIAECVLGPIGSQQERPARVN
jgi:alkylation response protein AidB-like acyl-CoA dehydrogenase